MGVFSSLFGGEPEDRSAATLDAHSITHVDYGREKGRPVRARNFRETVPRISPKELELAYKRSGVLFKGINKKARDAVRKGFVLVPDSGDREEREELNREMREWMRLTKWRTRSIQALKEMYIFGDGFLEYGYKNDRNGPREEPSAGALPTKVFNVDPMSMLPVRDPDNGEILWYLNGENVRDLHENDVKAWLEGKKQLPKIRGGVNVIHPERIIHFQVNAIREDVFALGISVIEAAYTNTIAKLAGDTSAADVLEWYSKGFYVVNIEYATEEELKDARKMLEKAKAARKNYFVGSERSQFDIKTPKLANVKPFYDNFYIEIAAALEMPSMVLLGLQKGTVTGSEVDLTEYYDDINAFQELLLEDELRAVLSRVLNRDDYSFKWVPLYVNKQTEADIRFKDSQSASQLFGSGILSRREAVRFMESGELPNPEDVPDDYSDAAETDGDVPEDGEPDEAEQPPEDEDPDESFSELPTLEALASDADALLARWKYERRLGESILNEYGASDAQV